MERNINKSSGDNNHVERSNDSLRQQQALERSVQRHKSNEGVIEAQFDEDEF